MPEIRLIEEELRFKFYRGSQFCLAYNKGFLRYGDFYLSRPNFYPVYSPSGRQATTASAYRFNHHKSIFIGHANMNGVNFFHDNNPTRNNLGDIRLVEAEGETDGRRAVIRSRNLWTSKAGAEMLSERRDMVWTPDEQAYALDISSALVSEGGEVVFGKDTHSYIGIRVADTMDVEDGGRAVNSKRRRERRGRHEQIRRLGRLQRQGRRQEDRGGAHSTS